MAKAAVRPLKVAVTGPWTLAASVFRPLGGRVLADRGARRDVAQSIAAGVRDLVADVERRLPGVEVLVQVDEPALPAVLAGAVPTEGGYFRHRAVDRPEAVELLRELGGEEVSTLSPIMLATLIKALPLPLSAPFGLARAISSAGGIARDAVKDDLMLQSVPGVFVAGEMLDWEAPTGGYLLQATFATALHAAHGIEDFLKASD